MSSSLSISTEVTIGVLAVQGDFAAHRSMFRKLGCQTKEVRIPADLDSIDGLVIPGGESTTITHSLKREGLVEPITELVIEGLPIFGTCAGMIMLDRAHLNLMNIVCERNAFGSQIHSFETLLQFKGIEDPPIKSIFIRAPWVLECGDDVEVLASVDDHPIAVRQKNRLAIAFHPEIAGEERIHRLFLEMIAESKQPA